MNPSEIFEEITKAVGLIVEARQAIEQGNNEKAIKLLEKVVDLLYEIRMYIG